MNKRKKSKLKIFFERFLVVTAILIFAFFTYCAINHYDKVAVIVAAIWFFNMWEVINIHNRNQDEKFDKKNTD